ncbi:phosphonate metabolism protein PhnP [Amphritea pacifica]|uniref:Phosphonate metabolism protein PhnP n=1 Tax=Amphritea pacifica TaxID=2811233 RepID=A0ABS2W6S0_9GAMM|nr:phosphonate metabolism protein PhnP [Amphritea pacifica]MBN0987398.1 phosphonate metabolism protein PhnP [Amphritea pacifica]
MLKIEFLGSGNAAGVPVWGCRCSACLQAQTDPAKRRRSASLAIHTGEGVTLVDAGLTDLAERFSFDSVKRVLLTHFHMDHVQGLFHLRWSEEARQIPVFRPDDPLGADDLYKHPGVFQFQPPFKPFDSVEWPGFRVVALPLIHSRETFGYLISNGDYCMAYLTDTAGFPAETLSYLQRYPVDDLVLDCSEPPRESMPRNHNDLNTALDLWRHSGATRLWLTHISHRLDCWLEHSAATLPEGVHIARDGMLFEIEGVVELDNDT